MNIKKDTFVAVEKVLYYHCSRTNRLYSLEEKGLLYAIKSSIQGLVELDKIALTYKEGLKVLVNKMVSLRMSYDNEKFEDTIN